MNNSNHIPDFSKIAHKITSNTPRMAATEAVKFFRESFVREGFLDRSLSPWGRRQSPLGGKRLLFGTGNLMRSIRPRSINASAAIVESDTLYSALHNEGGTITVTPQMKKYWWAQYYKLSGKVKKTSRGRVSQSKTNRTTNRKAEFCKAMALMKTGSKIKIPKRQFMGHSETLMSNLDKWVATQINQFLNND